MSEVIRDLGEVDGNTPAQSFAPDPIVDTVILNKVDGDIEKRQHSIGETTGWDLIWAFIIRRRWFMLLVVFPTLLSALYYFLIASDQYVTESRFVIKAPNQRPTQVTSLANLIQTSGMSFGLEQTNEVIDYLHTRSAVGDLSKKIDLKRSFQNEDADFLSRYPSPWRKDRFENLYSYYNDMVEASIDSSTSIAVVRVRAFSPQDAYRINEGLLQLSEAMVNRLSDRAQHQAVAEAEIRVGEGEARLRKARLAMSRYRESEKLVDPAQEASGVLEISNRLITERTALQAQLELMTQVAPENPSIPAIRRRLEAANRAIASQFGRAVGTNGALAEKLPGYENVAVEQEMATQNYKIASAALEQARLEAQNQHFYLERIASPVVPDTSQYPHRFRMVVTIAFAALCLYFIGWMLVVGILEHAPED